MKQDFIDTDSSNGERLFLKPLKTTFQGKSIIIRPTYINSISQEENERMIARHKGRYGLVSLFCRPDLDLLDFPCGSGYAAELLKDFNINYEGRDNDDLALHYANCLYANTTNNYIKDDLSNTSIKADSYDIIACIEGLEHIYNQQYIICQFHRALRKKGVLIISTPENKNRLSGPNPKNKFHKMELNRADFISLLSRYFEDVELITLREKASTGETTTFLYGICHK